MPGLVLDSGRWQWLTARVGLNVGIAAYCVWQVQRERAPGAAVAAVAMALATVADTQAVAVLHRTARVTAAQ